MYKYLILLVFLVSCEGTFNCDCTTKQGMCVISDKEYVATGCIYAEKAIDAMQIEDLAWEWTMEFLPKIKDEKPGLNIIGLAWCNQNYMQVEYNRIPTICHELYHLEICARFGLMDHDHTLFETWDNPCQKF